MASSQFIGSKNAMGSSSPAPLIPPVTTVVGQFNLSLTAQAVSDWVNLSLSPTIVVRSASDSRSGSAIGLNSAVASDTDYWNPFGTNTNAGTAATTGTGLVLPSLLYAHYYYQYTIAYVPGKEQLRITGLNNAKTYKIEILSSRQGVTDSRTTTIYCVDNVGSSNQTAIADATVTNFNFTFTGKVPALGVIKLGLQRDAGTNFAYVNAIKITQEN